MGRQGGTGRSVMVHQFSQSPQAKIERSSFDRSHGYKTTMNETDIVPIYVDEALPGDTFSMNVNAFARLATPIVPFMDNVYMDFFFFFVPYRLIWTHFVNFFGEQANPTDTTSYLVPTITVPAGNIGTDKAFALADYMGIPILGGGNPLTVNVLPFRAYNLIWNQWFRDENLQNSVPVPMTDGPDTWGVANYSVLPRGKRKDYFTSCLPWPQKGPAVGIPIAGQAPIQFGTAQSNPYVNTNSPSWRDAATGTAVSAGQIIQVTAGGLTSRNSAPAPSGTATNIQLSNAYADLAAVSSTTLATINSLRQAFQIQKIYERDARGGTRYIELIKAHFGVTSPDARLQRAEYLGGGSTPLNINPIAQTSGTGGTGTNTPLGNLAAMGTLHCHGIGFTKSFTEHGVVLGLANLRADINYQDGLEKMWLRSTRFDFYWPALAHIGEQAVTNAEIWAVGTANDPLVFGYQERYAEYRYKISRVTGYFRSTAPTPLDTWHLSQHFSALPALNATFIQDAPPISRVVAVPSQPRVLLDCYYSLKCARPMPVYGVPGMVDHF